MVASVSSGRAATHASCHGSFGELLQGALPEHGPFLVTLPIELRARVRFVVQESSRELRVEPGSSWKALALAEALLRRYALPARGELTLASEIPPGKGLASSTADLVATYRAIAGFHQLPQQIDVLESLLREIEPSDGVMHESVVAYRHRDARLLERLGPVPPLVLVAVDEGGEVETLAHNTREPGYTSQELDEFESLFARLRGAFRNRPGATSAVATTAAVEASDAEAGDAEAGAAEAGAAEAGAAEAGAAEAGAAEAGAAESGGAETGAAESGGAETIARALATIGAVATRSAEINQRILPKRSLGQMIGVAAAVGAAGVVAAHSGTCLALLIDALDDDRVDRVNAACEHLTALGLQPRTLATLRSRVVPGVVHV
jgi:uncharacterized protein involved in propanediol utilization